MAAAGRNKLHAAAEALGRAHDRLRRGRRNTRWWRHFYNLRMRLYMWRLWESMITARAQLKGGISPISPRDPEVSLRELQQKLVWILECLRRGMSALRHRANLEPKPVLTVEDLEKNTRYPFRVWQSLYCVGLAATVDSVRLHYKAMRILDLEELIRTHQEQFQSQFRNLTESFGFCWEVKADGKTQETAQPLPRIDWKNLQDLKLVLQDLKSVLIDQKSGDDLRSYVCLLSNNRHGDAPQRRGTTKVKAARKER